MKKFEKGKKYMFKKDLYIIWHNKCYGKNPLSDWYEDCENKEVNICGDFFGRIGLYSISALWCEEIK